MLRFTMVHSALLPVLLITFLLLLISIPSSVEAQDRESLTRICDAYKARNQTIRIGVLDKGDSTYPMSAWGGVFGTIATNFLSRFGCTTSMTLYGFAALLTAAGKGQMDFIFSNPIQGTQVQAQYGATPLVSLTTQWQAKTNRLPYPGVAASLDRFGAILMYANTNMTKDGTANGTVPAWLQTRRAAIQQYSPQTWDDLVSITSHFPKKNLTMCAVSATSLGGFAMASYEFFKRNTVIGSLYKMNFVGSHAECVRNLLIGNCDFATARTGTIEVWLNDTRVDPGTFTVINNNPTPFFPLYISTQLYPEWPVMYMPSVDSALVKAFTVPLTALSIITNTPEANAVSGASFSYPFSYDEVKDMMFQLNSIGTGECDIGHARQNYSLTPATVDPNVPQGCFPCLPGTFVVVANGTSTCTPCPMNTFSLTPTTAQCAVCPGESITHQTGSTSCVSPTKLVKEVSDATSYGMVAVCAISLFILSVAFVGVCLYRNHQVMKASSPTFLLLVLIGIGTLCASILPRALENKGLTIDDRSSEGDLSISSCLADIYLTNIGYTLLTSALLVKTWRLHTIFSSTQLAGRTAIKDTLLLTVVGMLVLLQVVILIALTESAKMGMYLKSLDSKYDYFSCALPETSSHSLLSLYLPVQIVPRFALLIGTTIAAFLVRNLPASFNESTQLLSAMYNLVFFSILLPAIDAAVGRGTNAGVIAYSISVVLICLLTAAILFVPKFLLIIVGMEKPNGRSVETNSKLSSSMVDTASGSNKPSSKQQLANASSIATAGSIGKTQPATPTTRGKMSSTGSSKVLLATGGARGMHQRVPTLTKALPEASGTGSSERDATGNLRPLSPRTIEGLQIELTSYGVNREASPPPQMILPTLPPKKLQKTASATAAAPATAASAGHDSGSATPTAVDAEPVSTSNAHLNPHQQPSSAAMFTPTAVTTPTTYAQESPPSPDSQAVSDVLASQQPPQQTLE